jgi:geranylgeranyl diphosphate synthase type II
VVISKLRKEFLEYLESVVKVKEPTNLYEPIEYILKLGGKRMRPVLTLMSADLFGVDFYAAMNAAMAVEVFHNFTLVHDDIMDDAPLRRGKVTVHEKWNPNIGILSGDAMMISGYQYLETYDPEVFKKLVQVFSKTAIEVCEGQQMDVDFETRADVKIEEYLKMIGLKTSVLVGCALKMGAIVAKTSEENAQLIYNFGLNLGLAFQLQDDYLDTYGDPITFGKIIGGDIMENKKTFLYLVAIRDCNEEDHMILLDLYSEKRADNKDKIRAVKRIFSQYEIPRIIKTEIEIYTQKAFECLDLIAISKSKKVALKEFGNSLMQRDV